MDFEALKVIASRRNAGPSAADVQGEPSLVVKARGTTVIPKEHHNRLTAPTRRHLACRSTDPINTPAPQALPSQ